VSEPSQAPRRSDARRNRSALLAAAREVFAAQGVDASLEEIARRASLGTGTLYRHFPSRDALLDALFDEHAHEWVAVAEQAASLPDGWAALTDYLESTIELRLANRALHDVFAQYPREAEDQRQRIVALLEDVLERARAEGSLRADFTLADLTVVFWSLGPVIEAGPENAPHAARRQLQFILDGMRPGAATPQTHPPLTEPELAEAAQALRRRRGHSRRQAKA
jgi:AcrR family transcriptional regulator